MFNSTNNTPFTMPVMPATGGYGNDGAFSDGGWLWIIVVFALLFGWGNNGFGGFGGNGGGYVATAATQADIQRGFDTQSIIGKLDGISNGMCDGFYAQNTTLMNGFHGVDNAICNLGYQTQQGFNTTNVALMQGQNALQAQLADCCCQNREAIAQVRYDMAQDTCALQNTMNTNTRDIIDNQNAGTRAILDYLCRSDGSFTVGVTDNTTHCICLSNRLVGGFKRKVLIHELCHAVCMSYNIHIPLEQEEFLCDFVATYGDEVFDMVDMMVGEIRKTA